MQDCEYILNYYNIKYLQDDDNVCIPVKEDAVILQRYNTESIRIYTENDSPFNLYSPLKSYTTFVSCLHAGVSGEGYYISHE
jgi:hypothetical protein